MNQQKANKIFRSGLGTQVSFIFVTKDDKPFIRAEEAEVHAKEIGQPGYTVWVEDDYWIEVKDTGNKSARFTYQVFANSGEKVGELIGRRRSDRTYVACLVVDMAHPDRPMLYGGTNDVREGFTVTHWFGRKNLVGKGDSRHLFGKPGVAVAYLNTEEE